MATTSDPVDGWTLGGTPFQVTTTDGVVLAGETAGAGPTVVLVHCWTGDRTIWEPVAARLASTHRVVVFDHRDHGASTESPTAPSIERLGLDIAEVVSALDLERPVLAGHSMGGMAAIAAATGGLDLGGLVLVSTSARPGGRPPGADRLLRLLAWLTGRAWLQRRVEGRAGRWLVRGSLGRRAHPQAVERTRACFAAIHPRARADHLRAIAAFERRDDLSLLDCPTWVVTGRLDALLPPGHARDIADRIPGSTLSVLPDAGHMLPLERADAVADHIHAATSHTAVAG